MSSPVSRMLAALIAAASTVMSAFAAPQRDTTEVFRIYYYVDHADLDVNFMHNAITLREMDRLVDSLLAEGGRMSVRVVSGASPEGTEEANQRLGEKRSQAMRSYLLSHHYGLQERDLTVASNGSDWDGLLRAVERSRYYWGAEAARIIRNTPIWVRNRSRGIVDSRKKQLMDLHLGDAWRTMEQDLFPYLRKTEVAVSWALPVQEEPVEPRVDTVVVTRHQVDTVVVQELRMVEVPKVRCGVILYTNTLYDLAAVPSVGVVVPLPHGWAVDGRWDGAWWSVSKRDVYWRVYGAELAVKKYFDPSAVKGHHAGVYGQIFTFDFELGGKGYMGGEPDKNIFADPGWGAGLEYGYTLPIGRHLNLDFGIGLGYMQSPLQKYEAVDGHYYRSGAPERLHWWGPTRADVSLQWLIGAENKRKR